jgi:hypothetical protein
MDVIGMNLHAVMQLDEVILTVSYGLENMDVPGMNIHVIMQLKEVI